MTEVSFVTSVTFMCISKDLLLHIHVQKPEYLSHHWLLLKTAQVHLLMHYYYTLYQPCLSSYRTSHFSCLYTNLFVIANIDFSALLLLSLSLSKDYAATKQHPQNSQLQPSGRGELCVSGREQIWHGGDDGHALGQR